MRKIVIAAVALAVAGTAASSAPGVVGAVVPAGKVRPWSPQFMDNSTRLTSETRALTDARNFSVLVAFETTYRPHVAKMKAANPALQLLVYMNAVFTWETTLPESHYAHDVYGRRITARSWSHTYMLEPTSAGAIGYQQRRAASLIAYSGYGGVYLDVLGPASLKSTYVSSPPVNPATGRLYTQSEWLRATSSLAGRIKGYVTPKLVVGNGLGWGAAYFDPVAPTEVLLDSGMHGAVPEAFLRGAYAGISAYPGEAGWKQNVDMLRDAGARGVSVLTVTKVYASGTAAQKDAWLKFALASFLLGNDGRHGFSFSYEKGDLSVPKKWTNTDIGNALGAYVKVGGVYQRVFERGKALVNPTKNTYTVALGGAYVTLDGRGVTSLTLAPHTAEVVRLV